MRLAKASEMNGRRFKALGVLPEQKLSSSRYSREPCKDERRCLCGQRRLRKERRIKCFRCHDIDWTVWICRSKFSASIVFLSGIELAFESLHMLISDFNQINFPTKFALLPCALLDLFAANSPEVLANKRSFQIMLFETLHEEEVFPQTPCVFSTSKGGEVINDGVAQAAGGIQENLIAALRPGVGESRRLERAAHVPMAAVVLFDERREALCGDAAAAQSRVGDSERVGELELRQAVEDGPPERHEGKLIVRLRLGSLELATLDSGGGVLSRSRRGDREDVREQRPGDGQSVGDGGGGAAEAPRGVLTSQCSHEMERSLRWREPPPGLPAEEHAGKWLYERFLAMPDRPGLRVVARRVAAFCALRRVERCRERLVPRCAHADPLSWEGLSRVERGVAPHKLNS